MRVHGERSPNLNIMIMIHDEEIVRRRGAVSVVCLTEFLVPVAADLSDWGGTIW